MSNKLINTGNLSQALAAFYTKSIALFATKTELDSGLAGKANSSHGTHVTYATTAPKANGTAAIGTVNRVAREDHVHPLQTSVSGNAGSANKVNSNLAIKLNGGTTEGTNLFTFNGSAAKTIDITPSAIGAAASSHGTHLTLGTTSSTAYRGDYGNTAYNHSQAAHAPSNAQKNSDITKAEIEAKLTGAITTHTHSYLPLSGGTMTGKITTPNNAQGITIGDDISLCDRNIADHLVLEGSTATNGGITFGSGKDTNIYRGGANLLKTDDTMNAVGGFQWNGQSLDNRYAAASHGTHLTIGTGASNAAAGNHTHNYAGSSSAGGAATSANKVNTNLAIKLNGGTTEGTNLFTFNGSAAKTVNITPSSIGAAASSHGTHVSYGGNGSASTVSRSDHTHTAVNGYTIWVGTQAQYDAITSKSSTTLYFIKE